MTNLNLSESDMENAIGRCLADTLDEGKRIHGPREKRTLDSLSPPHGNVARGQIECGVGVSTIRRNQFVTPESLRHTKHGKLCFARPDPSAFSFLFHYL